MSQRSPASLLRRYWIFAGAAFVLAALTVIGQWAFGG